MGKEKIVLDTNILISALGWQGKPYLIFLKVLNEEFELLLSEEQLDEIKHTLDYPKFSFTEEQKAHFVSILLSVANIITIPKQLSIIIEDPEDNIILETAIIGKADYLVSGDEHLLKLQEYSGVKILTASIFLDLFSS